MGTRSTIAIVIESMTYVGTWNANSNTPTLSNGGGGGSKGDYLVVNVAGTTSIDGVSDWEVGDWIVNNGTIWEKIDNTDKVSSVNGQVGVVSVGLASILGVNNSTGANDISVQSGQVISWNNGGFTGSIQEGTFTQNNTYTLPNASGTIALTSNANGVLFLNDLGDVTTGLPVSPTNADDGRLVYFDIDSGEWISDDIATISNVVKDCKTSVLTGSIPKGTPVYLAGYDNDLLVVEPCDNTSASTMACIGVTAENLDDTNAKKVISFGKLQGVDTSLFLDGDVLYVGTSGGFTTTRPTGTALIQEVAIVLKSDVSGGQLKIYNTSRVSGLPNLPQNNVWVGDANAYPVATPLSSLDQNLASVLAVGNSTGANDISVQSGQVISWNNGGFTGSIQEGTFTQNNTYTLPDQSGTIALLSDIPANAGDTLYVTDGSIPASTDRIITLPATSNLVVNDGTNDLWKVFGVGAVQMGAFNGTTIGGIQFDWANNKFDAQKNATAFVGSLSWNLITANRGWNLPDQSGTIALLSDIPATPTLSAVLTAGNTTGANDISVQSGQVISWNNGGFTGSIQEGTFTQNNTYTLPDQSGTIALLSDIPSLAGYVTGSGTTNKSVRWTSASTIGDGAFNDDGTSVGLNTLALGINMLGVSGNSGATYGIFVDHLASITLNYGIGVTAGGGVTSKGIVVGMQASSGSSTAGAFESSSSSAGDNYGITISVANAGAGNHYGIQILDGTEGAGKVLTSDASGRGTWQTISGGVSGSGTLNFIPKWTPDGTTLGDSALREDIAGRFGIGQSSTASTILAITTTSIAGMNVLNTGTNTNNLGYQALITGAGTNNYGFSAQAYNGTQYNIGLRGFTGATGEVSPLFSGNYGVHGVARGTGGASNYGGLFEALGSGSVNTGLWSRATGGVSNVALRLQDGSEGVGKILQCQNVSGDAQWVSLPQATQWQPPTKDLSAYLSNGASTLANANAGFQKSFSNTANDEVLAEITLFNNGVNYDGSNLQIRLRWQLFNTNGGVGDNVIWEIDYVFLADGDDGDSKPATLITDTIDVSTRTANQLYSDVISTDLALGNFADYTLGLTIRRRSSGAGADTYPSAVDVFGIELLKV